MKQNNGKHVGKRITDLDLSKMDFTGKGTLYKTAFLNTFSRMLKVKRNNADYKSLTTFGRAFRIN